MGTYASTTSVPWKKSRDEIESTLGRYGADQFAFGVGPEKADIAFVADGRRIRFTLPLPDPRAAEFAYSPERHIARTAAAREAAYDQAVRQRWRALALIVKAKLEAVASGIVTFEQEFYAHVVLPDGHTVYEHTHENVDRAYVEGHVRGLLEIDG
jgi:hypothetical protein